jgi:hypothetical protein
MRDKLRVEHRGPAAVNPFNLLAQSFMFDCIRVFVSVAAKSDASG